MDKKNETDLEEKRYTRKDLIPHDKEPLSQDVLDKKRWPTEMEQFETRIGSFVFELEEILSVLRNINTQGKNITTLKSPLLTNYLLWRMLNELKILNGRLNIPEKEKVK